MAYVISFFSSSMQMAQNSRSENFTNFTQTITRNIFQVLYKRRLLRLSIHFSRCKKGCLRSDWPRQMPNQWTRLSFHALSTASGFGHFWRCFNLFIINSIFCSSIKWIDFYALQKLTIFSLYESKEWSLWIRTRLIRRVKNKI